MELLPRDTEQEQSERVGKDPRRLGAWHTNTGLGFHTFNRGQKVETHFIHAQTALSSYEMKLLSVIKASQR